MTTFRVQIVSTHNIPRAKFLQQSAKTSIDEKKKKKKEKKRQKVDLAFRFFRALFASKHPRVSGVKDDSVQKISKSSGALFN